MIWDVEHECMSRSRLEELQLERLKWTVNRVYSKVPHYREKFEKLGIVPEGIKSVNDLKYLPFTTKEDLRNNYPFGLFAVPQKEVVRVHASSGTTGRPVVVGYTANDLNTWTDLTARMVSLAGVTSEDVAQIAFNYGLFTGGFGLHYGLERAGALVVPVSGGNTERQLMLMKDFGTTVLISTPSYSLYIAEVAEKMGIDISSLKLKIGLFGGEPWTEEMRKEIESRLNIIATDNYGLSEVMGPGVAGECNCKCGHHIAEDHFIVETIDPETGEVLEPGEEGELVFTSLTKEAFPVIRFRTKDISRITQDVCQCGRSTARMRKIVGRTDDMLIIRGVNVFPSQIESVLMTIDGIGPHYLINVHRRNFLDELEVVVELTREDLLEPYSKLEDFSSYIRQKLHSVLSINVRLKIVQPGTLERGAGKAKRVFDYRNQPTA
ncbi:coenzyme F390 synthetase [Desulfosporosinus orientis DSM 765]|uniref:Phenylacetate-coenzyme A ligase n=1 Tax=Desulfosporosinus orientis (strain ATCC 19365 / DSM 765 / NCIMB 8382 / VKM B-1628 / Singapore I) TaxID=768706 RepID=G7WAD8_DESOD|nr:phenylacetate--CoA ligase [Desulfosporosinus orientis]AET66487.1 coenzyme F390 synthetase [Desulfosporosinus orientis DSM 765]